MQDLTAVPEATRGEVREWEAER